MLSIAYHIFAIWKAKKKSFSNQYLAKALGKAILLLFFNDKENTQILLDIEKNIRAKI